MISSQETTSFVKQKRIKFQAKWWECGEVQKIGWMSSKEEGLNRLEFLPKSQENQSPKNKYPSFLMALILWICQLLQKWLQPKQISDQRQPITQDLLEQKMNQLGMQWLLEI